MTGTLTAWYAGFCERRASKASGERSHHRLLSNRGGFYRKRLGAARSDGMCRRCGLYPVATGNSKNALYAQRSGECAMCYNGGARSVRRMRG